MHLHPRQLRCPYCGGDRRSSALSNICGDCGREIRLGGRTVSPGIAAVVILAVLLAIVWAALVFA